MNYSNYSNTLPKRYITKQQCSVLHMDGSRCCKRAKYKVALHLDSELYSCFEGNPYWIQAIVCEECLPAHDRHKLKRS